jgi:chromosome segregation ATPase
MSIKIEPNPARWSPDGKALGRVFLQVFPVVATLVGGVWYIGSLIYNVGAQQERMLDKIEMMQAQVIDAKTAIDAENKQRTQAFDALKNDITPRIGSLEGAVHKAESEASAAHERIEDVKERLVRIEELGQQGLELSRSHSSDIRETRDDARATRDAVVPKDTDPGPPGR